MILDDSGPFGALDAELTLQVLEKLPLREQLGCRAHRVLFST
jgi:hypothetical protein